MACTKVESIEKALETVEPGKPVLLVDEEAHCLKKYHPQILIDEKESKKHEVVFRMKEGDEAKKFTILGFGYVE